MNLNSKQANTEICFTIHQPQLNFLVLSFLSIPISTDSDSYQVMKKPSGVLSPTASLSRSPWGSAAGPPAGGGRSTSAGTGSLQDPVPLPLGVSCCRGVRMKAGHLGPSYYKVFQLRKSCLTFDSTRGE